MKDHYDYLIVGAGIAGACWAYKLKQEGKTCLILEKNSTIGGLCYTCKYSGIDVHWFGPHIFHTDNKQVWDFVNSIAEFVPWQLNVKVNYKNKIYSLPFNMNTFNELYGITNPEKAKKKLSKGDKDYDNIKDWVIHNLNKKIYKIFIKGYTEKQWQRPCEKLPSDIIKRIPIRYTYNNSYFNDTYVGIPKLGYTDFINKLIGDTEVLLNTNYIDNPDRWNKIADKIIWTGKIDEYYDYMFGKLEYRSLQFTNKIYDTDNYQGCAVINYTEKKIPYTRSVEHKHFAPWVKTKNTIVTYETPVNNGVDAYAIPTERNKVLYNKYKELPNDKVVFSGRLAEYKYYDMDDVIENIIFKNC